MFAGMFVAMLRLWISKIGCSWRCLPWHEREAGNEASEQVSRLRSYLVTRLHQDVPLRRCGDAIEVKSPFGDAIVHVLDCSLRPCGVHLRGRVAGWLA